MEAGNTVQSNSHVLAPEAFSFNPIRPSLFSRSSGPGLSGLDAKNQSYHQLIVIKLCMGHYIYKSIPGAKFEVDSPFSFGDMTSQNFLQMKGTSHPIQLFTPGKLV